MLGRIEKVFSKFLFRISVPKCVACRTRLLESEKAICKSCYEKYKEEKTRGCSHCSKVLSECSCPNFYLKSHFVPSLSKLVRYNAGRGGSVSSLMIYRMKRKNREDLTEFVAKEVADSVRKAHHVLSPKTLVTHVPNRRSAIIERGFDHAEVLAKAVALQLGLEFVPLLVSHSKKPQKSMTQQERFENAKFDLIAEPDLRGYDIILIDDVVTSGASMGNSATMLRALRPSHIFGAAVAIAYRDEKILSLN